MSKVKIQGNASGTGIFTVAAPATNTDRTLTLPDVDATVLTTAGGTTTGQLQLTGNGIDGNLKIQTSNTTQKSVFWVRDTNLGSEYTIDVAPSGVIEQWHYDGSTWRATVRFKNGIVTHPNIPAFHAYGNQASLASGGTVIPGTTSTNNGSGYSTSTGRFTAPVAGNYYFLGTLDWNGATNGYYYGFEFRKNNSSSNVSQGIWQIVQGSNDNSVTHGVILNLAANDYVTMNASYQNTPGTTFSNFSGYLIG